MILVIDHPGSGRGRYADQYRLFRDDQTQAALEWAQKLGLESVSPFAELMGPLIPAKEGVATIYRARDVDVMVLRLPNP